MESFDIFISYQRADHEWVIKNLLELLKHCTNKRGRPLKIFFDTESIKIGEDWLNKIKEVILSCNRFVPVWSPKFWASEICRHELKLAHDQDINHRYRFVAPILREECNIPDPYNRINYLNAQDNQFESKLFRDLEILHSRNGGQNSIIYESPWGLDYDRDGRKITTLTIDNVHKLELIEMMGGHRDGVRALILGNETNEIISLGSDNLKDWESSIKIWEINTGRFKKKIPCNAGGYSMDISPDGKCIVGSDFSHIVEINLETGAEKKHYCHTDGPIRCKITPDGKQVISGSRDKTICRLNLNTEKLEKIYGNKVIPSRTLWDKIRKRTPKPYYQSHNGPVDAICITLDGKKIISKGGGILKLWDINSGRELNSFVISSSVHAPLVTTQNGRFIVWEYGILDLITEEIRHFDAIGSTVFDISISPDGKLMVCSCENGQLVIRNLDTGKIIHKSKSVEDFLWAVQFSRDQRRIITAGGRQRMHDWLSDGIYIYGVRD
jgi:WD40 repeat protein